MSLTVENQPDRSRYALLQDGEVIGVAEYDLRNDAIVFTHTEIDAEKREKDRQQAAARKRHYAKTHPAPESPRYAETAAR